MGELLVCGQSGRAAGRSPYREKVVKSKRNKVLRILKIWGDSEDDMDDRVLQMGKELGGAASRGGGVKTGDSFFFFLSFCLSGPHPQHMEVLRLRVELELQPLAYATAIVTWDLSRICDLHHSSWQCQILNPLSKARD